jgi:hypothetical protein
VSLRVRWRTETHWKNSESTCVIQRILRVGSLLAVFLCCVSPSRAATALVLQVDLPALIDKVADQPERFAVEVPQHISAFSQGEWTAGGSTRSWSYSVQVPTAVSLSFHASRIVLPDSAVLTVSGSRATVVYRARDINRGGIWGRPLVGDTLVFSLSVAGADLGRVQFEIDGLQAGYRGLGGLQSHPYYTRRATAAAASSQSCVENYSCEATSANQGAAQAVVAILIGNLYQCTGTLLNDTRSDFTPYVLTARHCESGTLGGGAPQAASAVTVYWDAVAPCGAALGSIYDGSAPVQSGATTIVEQQDAWLVKLDAQPVAQDAYWAGWDATGGVFTGGYSVHHALGYDKQFVGWYGQAILQHLPAQTMSVGYDSTFWGLVNQLGSVGAGASGGAVFDPNHHVVGSASLAALQSGANSAGMCPVNPPPAPAPNTVTAQYTALSAAFASTADSTSTTSSTLQSVLDPGGTGTLVMEGIGRLPVTLSADQSSPTTFDTLTLAWGVAAAQSCTASGGVAGDGWAGVKPVSGTAKLVNYAGGQVSYSLTCTGVGLKGVSTVSVSWIYVAPWISLQAGPGPVSIGGPVSLLWGANVAPCVASGGVPGDGWAGAKTSSGQQTVLSSTLGPITYALNCGTNPQAASTQASVMVVPVSVSISADSTQVRVGSAIQLNWISGGSGDSCSAVGGSASDGWAQQISLGSSGMALVAENTPGSYNYSIHCTGGGQSADSSVAVVFTNAAPSLTLSAVSATQPVYSQLPAQATTDLLWSSNVTGCNLISIGPFGNSSVMLRGQYPSGTAADAEAIAGLYTYQLQCGGYQASTTINWTNSKPAVTLTAPTTTWVANYPYSLFWTTNTTPCTQTGGVAGDGWAGNFPAGQSSATVTEALPGNYTFTLTCGTGVSVGQAQLNVAVPPPAASIGTDSSSVAVNQVITLTWNSTTAPCTSVDPSGGVNWGGGNVAPSGSIPIIENSAGTYAYSINCGTGTQTVHASTTVTVAAPRPTTIAASVMTAVINTPVTLTWNSSGLGVCTATGGDGSDGWFGTKNGSGTATVSAASTGTITYGVNCNNATAQTQVAYTAPSTTLALAPTPAATLTSNSNTQVVGQNVTLTWNSQNSSSCIASGGGGSDGWTGSLALSGSMQITESSAGADTYMITCTGAPPAATAQASVDFTELSVSGSAGTAKSGGGGAMDALTLLLLSLPLVVRLRGLRLFLRRR